MVGLWQFFVFYNEPSTDHRACNLFFIVSYTFIFSLMFRSVALSSGGMIATIMFMPDIVRYFGFGKYLPFYLLTFVYDSSSTYSDIPVPFVLNIFILTVLFIMVSRKGDDLTVSGGITG